MDSGTTSIILFVLLGAGVLIVIIVCFVQALVLRQTLRTLSEAPRVQPLAGPGNGVAAANRTPAADAGAEASGEEAGNRGAAANEGAAPQSLRKRGLDKATIDSLGPVREFDGDADRVALQCTNGTSAVAGDEEAGGPSHECAVCLSEFRIGESLRALNKCGHRFHQECIDEWLSTNPSCPLCRT